MLAPTDSYVSGKRNFIKRVTISHKQNIVIGGLHSRTSVKMTKKVINQHFCCLKRNIEVTETDCYIRYKNTANSSQDKRQNIVTRSDSCTFPAFIDWATLRSLRFISTCSILFGIFRMNEFAFE